MREEISVTQFLDELYDNAMIAVGTHNSIVSELAESEKELLNIVLKNSEKAKGVLTVLITSLVYKYFHSEQDIRMHQVGIVGGYSGRSFDAKNITPFMKKYNFPAMAESGWLTRALEQKVPYDQNYSGAITPKDLKPVFLSILANIENGVSSEMYLQYLVQGLILKRNSQLINLAKPTALSINSILELLDKHFSAAYSAEGASRLPVLALYAAYQCLLNETKRFSNKVLLPLESHTSSDMSSGRIGDIEIIDEKNRVFEAVEVKHKIPISLGLVKDSHTKFQTTPVNRYYILSTAQMNKDDVIKINEEIQRIKLIHGCQVIVNGIIPTLKYYLRLLDDTYEFIENYVHLIESDAALKFEHKDRWNTLISQM